MKICKCVSCKRPFVIPDNYFGYIYCEDCEEKDQEQAAQNVPTGSADVYPLLIAELSDEQYKVVYTQIYTIINYWKHSDDFDETQIKFGKAMVDIVKKHLAKLGILE
jgi:hypothetical protein